MHNAPMCELSEHEMAVEIFDLYRRGFVHLLTEELRPVSVSDPARLVGRENVLVAVSDSGGKLWEDTFLIDWRYYAIFGEETDEDGNWVPGVIRWNIETLDTDGLDRLMKILPDMGGENIHLEKKENYDVKYWKKLDFVFSFSFSCNVDENKRDEEWDRIFDLSSGCFQSDEKSWCEAMGEAP